MRLNSSESLHGIFQDFSTLGEHAIDGCRIALHKDSLFCVYAGANREIMYAIKPPSAPWGAPLSAKHDSAHDGYTAVEPVENPAPVVFSLSSNNIPSLVSFQDALWLIYTDDDKSTVFRRWDEHRIEFTLVRKRPWPVQQSASFAQLKDKLYMFYKVESSNNIFYISTTDMVNWSTPALIKKDGINTVTTYVSPAAITYQGLIHLVYKDTKGGFYLVKSDGEHWTGAIALTPADYTHSPGIAVHNGLLKLVFCNLLNAASSALYQYSYDGNALSPAMASTLLSATGTPALGTQDGKLIVTYLEKPSTN